MGQLTQWSGEHASLFADELCKRVFQQAEFITATVSQTETRLGERIDRVEAQLTILEQKVDDGFAGVAEAIDEIHSQLDEHEKADKEFNQRLTKLEQHAV